MGSFRVEITWEFRSEMTKKTSFEIFIWQHVRAVALNELVTVDSLAEDVVVVCVRKMIQTGFVIFQECVFDAHVSFLEILLV